MTLEDDITVSVVCPFYNEGSIIEGAIDELLRNLSELPVGWELLVVNDGSTDDSWELARARQAHHPYLRVLGYPVNRGRGYAIRTGVAQARGNIVVTTEIDLSWGEDIVQRLLDAFEEHPDADVIIASPNLPTGGYSNVPLWRVWLSQGGNQVIRAGLSREITMYTGMTRAYRRSRFMELPLDEDEKEQHLEIVRKAMAFGYKIVEIPAVLTWKTDKLAKPGAERRRSSAAIARLISSHLLFSLQAAPLRYTVPLAALCMLLALGLVAYGVINFFTSEASVFAFISAGIVVLLAVVLLVASILTVQLQAIQRGQWQLRRELRNAGMVENAHGPTGEEAAARDEHAPPQ